MLWKSLLTLGVLTMAAAAGVIFLGSDEGPPAATERDDSTGLDDQIGLGGGAWADWAAAGSDTLDERGMSPVSNILLHGRNGEDIVVRIEATCVIGALHRLLVSEDVPLRADEDLVVPLDVTAALGMHERQYAYPTRVRTYAAVLMPSGKLGKGQSLDQRYLAARKDRPHEIYDFAAFAKAYPRGITDPEELARMTVVIRNAPAFGDEAVETPFIAPAIYVVTSEEKSDPLSPGD